MKCLLERCVEIVPRNFRGSRNWCENYRWSVDPRSPVCRRPCVSRPGRPHRSWCSDPRWYSRGKTTRRTLARCRSRCTSSYSREAGTILRSPSYTGRLQRSRNLYRHVHSAPTQLNYSELSRPQLPSSVTFTSLKMF